MRDSNIPFYDITPLMVMNDKDALVFGGFVLILGVVLVLIVVWGVRKIQSRPLSIRAIKIQEWNAIPLETSKKAAYEMSQLGRFFAQDNDEVQVLFDKLERELEQHKYVKNVAPLNEKTLQLYRDISLSIR